MLRVNGLYGWVSYNDSRSAMLFLSFVLTFHVLAAVVLFIPLAIQDPTHAPIYNWAGYGMRYVPAMTLIGAGVFLVQFWWHVNLVRRQSGFRYCFKGDEPRLCRIAEPLVIASGLPEPRLAVIESPALNAFACGLGQKGAVVVFTRGLLEELDDDELAAVIAHELVHIRNGDLRLMAAATVCQRSMAVLYNQGSWGGRKKNEALSLGLSLLAMPVLFLVFVAVYFLRHSAIHFGHITRALISAAREFIADSEAVRLTQNPAALVSALQKIDGRSYVACLPAENDAMMIDGPSEGTFATHPGIAERVAAIVRVTGSMAVIAPAQRDTRPNRPQQASSSIRSSEASPVWDMRQKLMTPASARASSVAAPSDRNMLGFTREMNIAASLAIVAFLVVNRADLTNPRELAAHFDLTEFSLIMSAISKGSNCNAQGLQSFFKQDGEPPNCEDFGKELAEYKGKKSYIGRMFATMNNPPDGMYSLGGGRHTNVPPDSVKLAIARQNSCFDIEGYSVGDRGLHSIYEQDSGGNSDVSLTRYMGYIAESVSNIDSAVPQHRDTMLKSYVRTRMSMISVIHRFYGEPGLDMAMSTYTRPAHAAIVATIKERLADPAFSASLTPLDRAAYDLLTSKPDQFITCVARKTRPTG